jgi:UDP-N-acetylmuramoyl-tripeptide--D-alanyl-D-alanine ligase
MVRMRLLGMHNAQNVAAAVAAAIAAEPALKLEHVAEAVESMTPGELRCQMEDMGGVHVIADCYNANPESVRAALEVLTAAEVTGRRIALLGEMKELGDSALQCHHDVGVAAAEAGLSLLVAVGAHAGDIVNGARGAGMAAETLQVSPDVASAAAYLNNYFEPGDCVLVKGSRGVQMEDALETWRAARHAVRA